VEAFYQYFDKQFFQNTIGKMVEVGVQFHSHLIGFPLFHPFIQVYFVQLQLKLFFKK